jgi:hypothetical protein
VRLATIAVVLLAGCKSSLPVPPPRVMPSGATFSGDWESSFGPMHLSQNDDWVFGRWGEHGAIFGQAVGDQLRFNWKDHRTRKWGQGFFVMAPDGTRMRGQLADETDTKPKGSCWARRAAVTAPPPPSAPAE